MSQSHWQSGEVILKGMRFQLVPENCVQWLLPPHPCQPLGLAQETAMVRYGRYEQQGTAISWAIPSLSLVLKASKMAIRLSLFELYVPVHLQFPLSAPPTSTWINQEACLKAWQERAYKAAPTASFPIGVSSPWRWDFGSQGLESPLAQNMGSWSHLGICGWKWNNPVDSMIFSGLKL